MTAVTAEQVEVSMLIGFSDQKAVFKKLKPA